MKWQILTAMALAAAMLACQPGREARLVWEGDGAPSARTLTDAVRDLETSFPGVRTATWGESADASYQILEAESAEKPHLHRFHDLTVVLLRGRGVLIVAGRRYEMETGDVVHVGRGRPHHFSPLGRTVGLVIYTPQLKTRDYEHLED